MAFSVTDLVDPRWFAVDLHVPDRRFAMLQIEEDAIARSSFLDTRIEAPLGEAVPCAAAAIERASLPAAASIGWLFHTSFCASTLLARALHLAPHAIALKEPLVLRRLSDARKSGWSLDGLLDPAVRLLGRPWHAGASVVIKPTHVALNIAGDLLAAAPASRAVILTSSLEEFLISNLKKPASSQAKIPLLADQMLRASGFGDRLPSAARQPPDALCAAGVQWAATRELVQDVATAAGAARVRVLDMQPLLADVPGTVIACARWLGVPAPRELLAAHAAECATHNAKELAVPYGTERRTYEAQIVVQHFGEPLRHAMGWLGAHVLPAMRSAARATPPAWPADAS